MTVSGPVWTMARPIVAVYEFLTSRNAWPGWRSTRSDAWRSPRTAT